MRQRKTAQVKLLGDEKNQIRSKHVVSYFCVFNFAADIEVLFLQILQFLLH